MVCATGTADPSTVWERYLRPETWSGWAPQVRRVDCADQRLAVGSRGVVHGPWPTWVPFTVEAVDEAGLTWSWRLGMVLTVTMQHGVEEVSGGTRAWARLPGPRPARSAYAPVARAALRRLVRP